MNKEHLIYKYLTLFDSRVRLIPKEDVNQEIRIALYLTSSNDNFFREASKGVNRLLCDYGYRKRGWKDHFPFYDLILRHREEGYDFEKENKLQLIETFYLEYNYTAREICEFFCCEYTDEIKRYLSLVFPKSGPRTGKSGITFPYSQEIAKKLADLDHVSDSTLRVWKHRGKIPCYYLKLLLL